MFKNKLFNLYILTNGRLLSLISFQYFVNYMCNNQNTLKYVIFISFNYVKVNVYITLHFSKINCLIFKIFNLLKLQKKNTINI